MHKGITQYKDWLKQVESTFSQIYGEKLLQVMTGSDSIWLNKTFYDSVPFTPEQAARYIGKLNNRQTRQEFIDDVLNNL